MGFIHADLELVNHEDVMCARKYIIGEEEIKKMNINMLVDTGAFLTCINENIQEILQFPLVGTRKGQTADGRMIECPEVGGIILRFKNREHIVQGIVLPGDSEPLLGVLAMEALDVLVDPVSQQLIVNPKYPDGPVYALKGLREPKRELNIKLPIPRPIEFPGRVAQNWLRQ